MKKRALIISYCIQPAFTIPLNNLLNILSNINNQNTDCIVASRNEININNTNIIIFTKLKYFSYLKLYYKIFIKLRAFKPSYVIFFMEGNAIIPMLICKIFNIKIVKLMPSFITKESNKYSNIVYNFLNEYSFRLCTKLILYSTSLTIRWRLHHHFPKILIGSEHLNNLSAIPIKNYIDRKNNICFIGRFSKEKGIIEFIKSLNEPELIELIKVKNFKVKLVGGGELKEEVYKYININKLDFVELVDWIPHNEVINLLVDSKLIVIPSKTEGLPNILLEAIACKTPVLTARVGSIDSFFNSADLRFLKDNSSTTITNEIKLFLIGSYDIYSLIENASCKLTDFMLQNQIIKWNKIINQILDDD